jgi:predicted transcriptional regulator
MSRAVMISIRPKRCEKICRGEKTIEVRKTRPKLETPFKCYIYCTKARERLITILKDGDENYGEIYRGKPVFIKTDEGSVCDLWGKRQKVIGEFVCDRIFPIDVYDNGCIKDWNFECMWQACLPYEGIAAYIGREKRGYGWHISDLKIYDAPRELGEFRRVCVNDLYCESCAMYRESDGTCGNESLHLKRPFQSWGYVENMEG